jgi:hypothetical protein
MRTGKVVLIAAAAVIVYTGTAQAITVKKKRDAPGETTAVWALVGSFCAIRIGTRRG